MLKRKRPLIALSILGLMTFVGVNTSCSGLNNTSSVIEDVSIIWKIGHHASVKIEGSATLIEKIEKGKTLVFTIELESGYQVKSVKVNKKVITPRDDKYSIRISSDTEIVIDTIESIASLEVKSKPDKLVYFSGEKVDTSGMEVEVTYLTGRKEIINNDDNGYHISPSVFVGGETSFQVIYGDKISEVTLEKRVEHLISINTSGGKIDQTWTNSLKAKNLNNLEITDEQIKFSFYDELEEIILPTSREMHYQNYAFVNWNLDGTNITSINKENVTSSISITADWQLELVTLTSCELKIETIDEEKIPYLVIKGKFKAVENVFLYLYEGNDEIGIKGEELSGSKNQDFEIRYDLRNLQKSSNEDKSFENKWMDIRFNTVINEEIHSMEVFVSSDNFTVDQSQKISIDEFNYMFSEHEGRLKVYYTKSVTRYTISYQNVSSGDETGDFIVIEGKILDTKLYANKTVQISWWFSSESPYDYGLINEDGNYKVMINVNDIPEEINGYAHFAIIEKIPDSGEADVLFGGTNNNLLVADSETLFSSVDETLAGGTINHAVVLTDSKGVSYYVGYKWDGLMMYKVTK